MCAEGSRVATFNRRRRPRWAWVGLSVAAAAVVVAACGGGGGGGGGAEGGTGSPVAGGSTPGTPGTPAAPGAVSPTRTYTFESGPVRPLALSPDGKRLFVANLPNGSLDTYTVTDAGLQAESSVHVGLDPVAVAARSASEVWVVNHLSDSVSVVDVAASPPRVTRTLLVGDEPRDIVFGGADRQRAFITTARRGQQRTSPDLAGVPGAGDAQLTTAGIGRADVWVFDAGNLGSAVGGKPLAILTLRSDTPRGLAVSPDGRTVYAAALHSGNRSTAISPQLPCDGFDSDRPCTVGGVQVPGSPMGPATNKAGVPAPRVGLIVKADAAGRWRDARQRDWSNAVRFDLPDEDLFTIDAQALSVSSAVSGVGTTLFNVAVNPRSGAVYVSNTEARNDLRFEGPGTFAGTTLQGQLAESRITVVQGGKATARHLNKHLNYAQRPAPASAKAASLSTPLEMVVSGDGRTLYVAAFGSGKVGVYPTAALEDGSFDPTTLARTHLEVSGGGPSGLVLDAGRNRLYVATRFDNGVSVIDLSSGREIQHLTLPNPEAASITTGRRFLYDAQVSSSNGEASCASCHVFGNTDHLAWDLGDPDADVVRTPVTIKVELGALGQPINGTGDTRALHPMKGPMGTQTLRGMANHGAMHWRGDRVDGFFGRDPRATPPFDSDLSFRNFIVGFPALLGKESLLATGDMQAFSAFTLAIVPPPNPVRSLDNSLTAAQARGRSFFMGCEGTDAGTGQPATCGTNGRPLGLGHFSAGVALPNLGFTCEGCHTLNPAQGFFGTDGQSSFEALPQIMKIPQLRNLYERVGMFGNPPVPGNNTGDNAHKGQQVRGYGFSNDGTADTVFRFLQARVFNSAQGGRVGFSSDAQRRDVEAFMLAFDSDLAPVVGQQVTLDAGNAAVAGPRIELLRARALAPFVSKAVGGNVTECELVVRGVVGSRATTFVLKPDGTYARDDGGSTLSEAALRDLARTAGQALTYTCMPPGWAPRL
ncbi:MAG: YncE family protein [Rubrivivax sp.]